MRLVVAPRGQGKTHYLLTCLRKDPNAILLVVHQHQKDHLVRQHPNLASRMFTHSEALFTKKLDGVRVCESQGPLVLIDDLEGFLRVALSVPYAIGDITTSMPCVNLNPYSPSVSDAFRND